MNPLTNVKNIQKINERMLEMGVEDSHGWHKQYKDSAYIFIGGLPYDLTEGDILCVFSQYGEIVNINLVREKKTGKTKGFCFLCYEDQRSTVLAVDNFNGIKLGGRTIRVDHCSNYRRPLSDEKDEHGNRKEIVEVGCAPKTPPPSPPQSIEDDDSLELRKKEKKEKKQKKHKEGKNQKKRKTTSSNEEDNGEKKQKLDSSKNELSKIQPGRVQAIETDRHARDKHDFYVKTSHEGAGDHDAKRDDKRKGDMGDRRYDSHGHDNNRECELNRARDRTNRDNHDRHTDDHREQRDRSAYRTSRGDRDQEFDERRKNRFDKQRDYRADEGRAHERTNRNGYGDRRVRR